ncbi:MAG: helix-turn-helix domain-containing protein [Thermomicrobiales bacterium]
MTPLGEFLLSYRVRAGLSQEALAEASGVSARTISDLERGQRPGAHLETVRMLASALDLAPEEQLQLLEAARPSTRRSHPSAAPIPPRASDFPWADTLPRPTTSLVGRMQELDALASLVTARTGEIVTIIGTGGVGKTRLAVELAHRVAPAFPDGAAFVGLATVPQAELVPDAIARALGAPSIFRLTALLASRELLLVLDNMEHVLDAAPFVAELNVACPQLTILATSRVRLRLSAERIVPLAPLPLAEQNAPLSQARDSDANKLFVERARLSNPEVDFSEQNAAAISEICRRLDGIPLAIELAASRMRVLTAPTLLQRLEHRLPVLTEGGRDLQLRQQSMRDAIAWSYELLSPDAQHFLRWASVFVGGISLTSADAICAALGFGQDATLEMVTTLFDGGMIYRIAAGDSSSRFQFFETIREFGLDQLAANDELDTAHRFHAEHFLALALQADELPFGLPPPGWVEQIDRERANIVQAFDYLCQPATAEQAVRFGVQMAWYWRNRGPMAEGQTRIARAIELAPEQPMIETAYLLFGAVYLIGPSSGYPEAARLAQATIDIAEQVGTTADKALALQSLAYVEEHYEHFDRAKALHEELLHIWESLDNTIMQALCLMLLGGLEYADGNLDRAQAMEERAVELFLQLGDVRNAAAATWYQGMFAYARNQLDVAAEKFDTSLRLWLEDDSERIWFKAFVGLADVASAIGLVEPAARLLGATEALLRVLGGELMPFDKPFAARAESACLRALEPGAFAALKEEGTVLTPDESLAESAAILAAARAFSQSAP